MKRNALNHSINRLSGNEDRRLLSIWRAKMNHRLGRIRIPSLRITYIHLAKFGLAIFVFYIFWFLGAFYENRLVLYGTIVFSTLAIIADMISSGSYLNEGLYSIIPLLLAYGIYSAATGIVAHRDITYLYQSLVTFFSFTIVCFDVCYVSKRSKSFNWIFRIMLFASILCAVQTIFFGVQVRSAGVMVTTMGLNNNPNALSLVMIIGIFVILKDLKGNKNIIIYGFLSLALLYVIILTGSRKSLIAAILLFGIWAIVSLFDKNIEISRKSKFLLLVAVIGVIGVIIYYYTHYFSATSAYERFLKLETGESINGRTRLYQQAVNLFSSKPIFGVGYDQYRLYVGEMSHSTYAEIIACSGIVGAIIWLIYIMRFLKFQMLLLRQTKRSKYTFEIAMSIGILIVEVVLGLGQVWYYDISHMLILTSVIGNMVLLKGSLSREEGIV